MAEVTIREAERSDLNSIIELLAQDTRSPELRAGRPSMAHAAALEQIFADANQQLLVVDGSVDQGADSEADNGADDDDVEGIIGVVQVTWIRVIASDGGLYCQVEGVRVDADHRRRGFGAELIRTIEALAKKRGAARIQFSSHIERKEAHAFYEGLGYTGDHVGFTKFL